MEIHKHKMTRTSYFMDKIEEVIVWLSEKGLKAHCSRYSRYKRYINEFYEKSSLDKLEEKFRRLNSAFQECVEIVQVYEAFHHETSSGFENRLAQVIKGQDFFDKSTQSDTPRDFLYELLTAANFKSNGYTIDFHQKTDVVAYKGDHIFFIECKRIKSEKALEENFRKAGKQLKETPSDQHYGLIYIDIYNCLSDRIRDYEYSSILEMQLEVNKIIEDFCKKNEKLIGNFLDKFGPNSLAVCFTAYRCLWLSDTTPQYFRNSKIIIYRDIMDEKYAKIYEVFNKSNQ